MNYQNHVIDPTYFYDAIEEFSFNFRLFVLSGKELDEYGNIKQSYQCYTIRGSLQSHGKRVKQSMEGNTEEMLYNFYCKSLYRIDIGDIIEYKGKYLRVDSVHDYDEFGCRSCSLSMINLTAYRDLAAYIKYIEGQEII